MAPSFIDSAIFVIQYLHPKKGALRHLESAELAVHNSDSGKLRAWCVIAGTNLRSRLGALTF